MKRHKRDSETRTYNHGYSAAVNGKSLSVCPYETVGSNKRHHWTSGWRDGRADQWDGKAAIAGLHKILL